MDSITTSITETARQHMSESVFVGLCHIVGTSQLVAMRREVMDIKEMVQNQSKKNEERKLTVTGSFKEGFRLKGSDMDTMFWPDNHRVIWELWQSQYYNIQRKTLSLCDCSDSPPGYSLLYLLSPSMNREIQRACVRMNNRHYISSFEYKQILCSKAPSKATLHGPVSRGILVEMQYDHAHSLASDFWPPTATSWMDRCHSWPEPNIVADIVRKGCHFVAVGHKLGNHEDNEWRISFSLAEKKLVHSMNHCQFVTYGLLKLFLSEIINNGLGDCDQLLCSYHMKTAVFWVIQQNTIPYWCPQNLLVCFWACFKIVLKWVYEGVCPNFFIPQNNMFLGKMHGEVQHHLFTRLYGLYEKGFEFLLYMPSIRSYIINFLHNPLLSVCTDEHTLISESAFDVELFFEILQHDTLGIKRNIQSYVRCLNTIEQLMGSPRTTQFQLLLLQKLTASVFEELAFILRWKTCACKNKLRYRADKISCHILKLTAKFGSISDMLYIVMYYYKTLRIMEALSIIEAIKVKLAQPYVMYRLNVDAEKYTEAVGGQSWSEKMRQAVALDIKVHNDILYISELIHEQASGLWNKGPFLLFPPFILLHMLEILCYRYVDTMRAQTALNDLQTLVHYDQGHFIHPKGRGISWQILGICQEMTGNLQDALYSYKQTPLQEPFHKIQTATEMRIQEIRQRNH